MYDLGFRIKGMLLCIGSWVISSGLLLMIFALADLQAWCAIVAIMLPGAIAIPLSLRAISKHEKSQPICEAPANQVEKNVPDERPEGYVRLFRNSPMPKDLDGTFDVYSEPFETFEGASAFADVFQHNYYTPGVVRETPDRQFYVVCNGAEACMLRSCFAENENVALVANWKYDNRGKLKAQEYFREKGKIRRTKIGCTIACVFVVLPLLVLTLLSRKKLVTALIATPIAAFICYHICDYAKPAKKTVQKHRKYSWAEIDQMDGATFEHFIGDLIVRRGYGSVKYTPATGDFGVDIILNGRTAIQCKRYSKALGIKPVQEVYTGMSHYGCCEALVVTNSYFTKNAIALAKEHNITLWDRNTLNGML